MRSLRAVSSALLVIVAAVGNAQTQIAAPRETVSAYRLRLLGVYDIETGAALPGADVTNVQTGISAPTNASGLVSLLFLPDGGGLVRIRRPGYSPVTRFVAISPSDTTPVTELLTKVVPTLPAVTTRDSSPVYLAPGLKGFEQRRASGFGRFISEAELRKRDSDKLAEVLRVLPGAMLVQAPGGMFYFVSSRKFCDGPVFLPSATCSGALGVATPDCYATIYLDGALYYSPPPVDFVGGKRATPATSPPDINKIAAVNELAGVEYYASDAILPNGFTPGTNGCGTLLLWTRER